MFCVLCFVFHNAIIDATSLEDCILQAKGEHMPTEHQIELQDEQNLNVEIPDDEETNGPSYAEGRWHQVFVFAFCHFCVLFVLF